MIWNSECSVRYTEGRWLGIQSLHLCIDNRIWLIPVSMKLAQIWWCSEQISEIWSLYHQIWADLFTIGICRIPLVIRKYDRCILSHPPAQYAHRASQNQWPFQNAFIMAQNQSSYLYIDYRILFILILTLLVVLWCCNEWIFGANKMYSYHAEIIHALASRYLYTIYVH